MNRGLGVLIIGLLALLLPVSHVSAQDTPFVYDFNWTSSASVTNLFFNSNGVVDFTTSRGNLAGQGTLTLTPVPTTGPNAFRFDFSGTNGSGSGFFTGPGIFEFSRSGGVQSAGGTAEIAAQFPTAVSVPSNANPFGTQGGGSVTEQGPPTHPTSFTVSFFQGPIGSHGCSSAVPPFCSALASTSFEGTGVLQTSVASAAEPALIALVAVALGAATVARRRHHSIAAGERQP